MALCSSRYSLLAPILLLLLLQQPTLAQAQPQQPTLAQAQPVPSPGPAARPAPYFSWATLPRAFHGANRSGEFTEDAILALSAYQMTTLEKWYTPCASQGPAQGNASCAVEDKMYSVFRKLKALQPSHTTILYLNSMFDFAFYRLNGLIEAREAAGERLLLRDRDGELVALCNDGNVYCGVTTFDHTNPVMRALWLEAVANATTAGAVDGVFADHASSSIAPSHADGTPQLCNGSGALRRCYNFTPAFADAFNAAHEWLVNETQDTLARLPGAGPVVDGPWASWAPPACNFSRLRPAVEAGLSGLGPFVLEANHGKTCSPSDSCIANFLAAAEAYTYLACFADAPPPSQPQFAYPLGEPMGPPVISQGVVRRSFQGPAGITNATVVLATGEGTMEWAGAPPPPPPPPPLPPACGALPPNTAIAHADIAVHYNTSGGAGACCDFCVANPQCVLWCFHGEQQDKECHLHSSAGVQHSKLGVTSGRVIRAAGGY